MKGQSYRITTPTLGIFSNGDDHRIPVTLPVNAIVTANEILDGNKFVEVTWEGKTITMFTQDLRARGELVGYAASSAGS